jgi:hypothetical protein
VFAPSPIVHAKEVKSQAVLLEVGLGNQPLPKPYPICRRNDALEDRVLYPATIIAAGASDAPEPPSPGSIGGSNIVRHQDAPHSATYGG